MRFWVLQYTVRVFVSAFAIVLALGVGEVAQAACYGAGQELSSQVVSRFTNDPEQLLTEFPSGGPRMISLIRDLVASDPGTLPLILDLNGKADTGQVEALGTGLGQASLICARTAPSFANEIQQMTVAANNQALTLDFAAVMGDLYLAAAGPGGVGGGGGPTGTNGAIGGITASGVPLNLTTSVPTASRNLFTLGFSMPVNGGGTPGNGGPNPNTNIGKSVSPSHP